MHTVGDHVCAKYMIFFKRASISFSLVWLASMATCQMFERKESKGLVSCCIFFREISMFSLSILYLIQG